MRVEAVHARVEHFALTRPYAIAGHAPVDAVSNLVVELHLAGGTVGLGAASPEAGVTGETWDACNGALAGNALDWLVGRDVREFQSITRELAVRMPATPAARAAVDIALHDAIGQALGIPLCDLLGRAHVALPTSVTIGIKPVHETLVEAGEYLRAGFRVLKVKTGVDLDQDIERLSRLRERVGKAVALRVDPNQGYSAAQTLAFAERTASLGLEFIEQPMHAGDPAAMRALPASLRERIAADESLLDEHDALALISPPRPCGIFNIKLMKCGGIRAGLRIAAVAETAGIDLMWGCMDESVVSIAAALHAALASPATRYLDLDGHLDLARDIATGGVVLRDGFLSTNAAPGLGLTTR